MISYEEFKKTFDQLGGESEITIVFNSNKKFMLIKLPNYLTYQEIEKHDETKYESLDQLYDLVLKDEWDNICDIIIDGIYSVINDRKDLEDFLDYC